MIFLDAIVLLVVAIAVLFAWCALYELGCDVVRIAKERASVRRADREWRRANRR